MGQIEALVVDRQADLVRQAGHARRGRADWSPEGGRPPGRAFRRRALSRGMGRILVAVGVRLAGPEALRGRIVLADGRR